MKPFYYYASVGVACSLALVAVFLPLIDSTVSDEVSVMEIPQLPESAPALEDEPTSASMIFFGDMMFGRHVETLTDKHGEDYLFEKIDDFLREQSYVIANLEGPIVTDHSQTPNGSFVFSFQDSTDDLLARHGFDLVSLANNHTLNQGDDGFTETQTLLDQAGVLYAGHPISMSEDYVVKTIIDELPVTFVGFNMTFPYNDPEAAVATIATFAEASADPIVVFMHWGTEYQLHSNGDQQTLAHQLIDAGADLIIGAHPHVVQEVEEYNGKLIFYSLGNFIFDQYFSTDTQQGLAVEIHLAKDGNVTALLHPLQSIFSQPMLMVEPARSLFLQALGERSDHIISSEIDVGIISLPKH